MDISLSELKKQIAEKNSVLNSLSSESAPDREKIRCVKTELDSLLYMYYKSLRLNCRNAIFARSAGA
jgi:hypothetical protein